MFKKLFILISVFTLALSGCEIKTPLNVESLQELQQPRVAVLNVYVEEGDTLAVANNLEQFLLETAEDAIIEIIFDLQFDNMQAASLSINSNSTAEEIDMALVRQREEAQEFFTSRNMAFLREHGFNIESELYIATISHFSPHIIKTFNSLADFERYSQNIEVLRNSRSVQRISVMEAPRFENRATLENPNNAPRYPMSQVRQDIGITNNTFTGRGINVGMIESGTPQAHAELSGVTIHRGGRNNQTAHARDVARTFVGSNGIAPGVAALHSFAAADIGNATFVNAMNWLLQPVRNVMIINISWGPPFRQYSWMDAFVDFISRNHNITFVVAPGNDTGSTMTPALGFNVISVGNSTANGNVVDRSSWGQPAGLNTRKPTIVAPGTRLDTINPPPGIADWGTSISAPVTAGVIARLMQESPWLRARPDAVKAVLIASATPVNGQAVGTWSARAGAGVFIMNGQDRQQEMQPLFKTLREMVIM